MLRHLDHSSILFQFIKFLPVDLKVVFVTLWKGIDEWDKSVERDELEAICRPGYLINLLVAIGFTLNKQLIQQIKQSLITELIIDLNINPISMRYKRNRNEDFGEVNASIELVRSYPIEVRNPISRC